MAEVNEDSEVRNSFLGDAETAIQAGTIHGGVHVYHPGDRVNTDAGELRAAEIYAKAADQLGSDKALAQMAGLHTLERLGQIDANQRQVIVDMVCAYLRMPHQPGEPADEPVINSFMSVHHRSRSKLPAGDEQAVKTYNHQMREREVRLAAQRLLADHLRPGDLSNPVTGFWPGIDLDLTGAMLVDFSLADCVVRAATFESATFIGHTDFTATTFIRNADFRLASFSDPHAIVSFQSTVFTGPAYFMGVVFAASAAFAGAAFRGHTYFMSSAFADLADFTRATFIGTAEFTSADFARSATFIGTTFNSAVDFYGANFPTLHTAFIAATFARHMPDEVGPFSSPENLRALWVDPRGGDCDS